VDLFNIGDQLRFVTAKTATKTESGIIVDINGNEFTIYMLGDNEPGTLKKCHFPVAFYYLDRVESTRKLDISSSRELIGMHVCLHLCGWIRRLGYVANRTAGFIYLKMTQIKGIGTIQSFMEELVTNIYWIPFTRFFPDESELVWEDTHENHLVDCRLQDFCGESGIPDADRLRQLNPLELYKCFLRYGDIDLISKWMLPGLQSHVDKKRDAAEENGCDTSHYIRFGSENDLFTWDEVFTMMMV
jgi:hypothetical protein